MIKFNRINGWSYKTTDGKFMISNCGSRQWFSAEIDFEYSEKFGWAIPVENSKVYHSSIKEAQQWVRTVEYKEIA
jgi:hypothetical protein